MRFQIWILAAMFLCTGILQADSGKADAAEKGSTDTSSKKSSTAAALRSGLYRVGIQDELQISVWREPELSVQVVVRPDGMISMPLLNDIPVIGLAPEELRELIAEKLKDFVNEPQVTIIVRQIQSRKVYLVGQVNRQGAFALNGRMTVLQLLAESGGLGPFAKSKSIYVLREGSQGKFRIPFSFKKALQGRRDADIALLPGDVVVVP